MVFSACHIWTLFTYYLHMYMSSTHYLSICVLCSHYLQWFLIYSFLTDSADVHIICLSFLTLLIYLIIHNLVFAHHLHTCTLSMSSVYCLQMYMLCTSDIYCSYLHMYMLSTYYLGICVLYTHYLQWSLICSFLTDNANVIHTSSLVLFIYHIIYKLVSAHCLHRCTLSMLFASCPHMYISFACHL